MAGQLVLELHSCLAKLILKDSRDKYDTSHLFL